MSNGRSYRGSRERHVPHRGTHERRAYMRVHVAIRRARGRAADYECVDCGAKAKDWSWKHDTDPHNVSSYEPRCAFCHREYDREPYGIPDYDPEKEIIRELAEAA